MLPFGLLLGVVWGSLVALFIQFTSWGRWISARLTWFIVSLGIGGDLLILLLFVDSRGHLPWWQVVAVIGVSSVPIAARSLLEFHAYFRGLADGIKDTGSE